MSQFFLRPTEASGSATVIELRDGSQTFGRTTTCDFVLQDAAVSKTHAQIDVEGGHVTIQDLGSRNGVYINGERIDELRILQPNDRLRLGHTEFILKSDMSSSPSTLDGTFDPQLSHSTSLKEIKETSGVSTSRMVEVLHGFSELLSKRLSLEDVYQAQISFLAKQFHTANRIFIIIGTEGDHQEIVANHVQGSDPNAPMRMSQTMLQEVQTQSRSFLIHDTAQDERFNAQQSIVSAGVQSAMVAPLFDNDDILGVVYLDSLNPLVRFEDEDLNLLTLLANMMAVKVSNARLEAEESERERLRHELDLAATIQRNLLPKNTPDLPGYDLHAFQEPCLEMAGDLYDWCVREDGRVWFCVGDITGKGVGAAMLMANSMAILRLLEQEEDDPVKLVTRMHGQLIDHVDTGQFLTLFIGLLDPPTGEFRYVNAGHPGAFHLQPGQNQEYESTGIPVALLPLNNWIEGSARLDPGDTLVVYSDAVNEAMCDTKQYDEGALQAFMKTAYGTPAKDLTDNLQADINTFRGHDIADDDLTLMVIRRLPE